MRPRPLRLGLLDQRLLVRPVLLRDLGSVGRRQGQLVVGAVEDSESEGGPSEDLFEVSVNMPSHLQLCIRHLVKLWTVFLWLGRGG